MPGGNNDVLHKVIVGAALPGVYWHVYKTGYSPVGANPKSKARLAWLDGAHGMFYTGSTRAAALWETVLRFAEIDNGFVYTDPKHLQNMVLARLTLTVPAPAIDLRTPYRRSVVSAGSSLDTLWDQVLKDPDHNNTHDITTRLMTQLAAAGNPDGVALIWYSRQTAGDTATLFYEPPMESSWWSYQADEIYPLDTPSGDEQIRQALADQNLRWRGTSLGPGFKPPPGAI